MPDKIRLVLNDEDTARIMAVLHPDRADPAIAPQPAPAAGAPAAAPPRPRPWLARLLSAAAGVLARFR